MDPALTLGFAWAWRRDGFTERGDVRPHCVPTLDLDIPGQAGVALDGPMPGGLPGGDSLGLSPGLVVGVLLAVGLVLVAFVFVTRAVMRSQTSVGKIARLAAPESGVLTLATLCLLLDTVCSMPLVWIFGQFINLVADHLNEPSSSLPVDRLRLMLILLLCAIVSGSILSALSSFLFSLAGERITRRLRLDFFRALLIQDMAFFDTHQSGEWLNRLSADAGTVQQAASTNLALFLNSTAQFVGGVLICMATSWQLFLIILFVMPVMAVAAVSIGKTLRTLSKQYQASLASAGGIAGETFGNIRTVRAFAHGEGKQLESYRKELDEAFRLGRRRARIGAVLTVIISLLVQLSIIGALGLGGWLVLKGSMKAGTLTSFLMYALWAAASVGSLVGLYNSMNQAIGASHRVFEVIERKPEIPSTLCTGGALMLCPERCDGAIAFEDVVFAYSARPRAAQPGRALAPGGAAGRTQASPLAAPPRGTPLLDAGEQEAGGDVVAMAERVDVLRGMTFQVPAGCMAALVGPSGGGKSTVMALLLRLYDPRSGTVQLDGHDLRSLDPRWLRRQLGVVSQEPVLFNRSIRENIFYGLGPLELLPEGVSVESVARQANAHDFITKLPEGYDAPCGERGVRLSGGQKQRVAIARALLLRPRVLLLDEATSALDAESERLVQDAMDQLLHYREGRPTVITIAHRLSTVKSADMILVVKDGKVEERGTHEELIRAGALYAKLASHQRLGGIGDDEAEIKGAGAGP